MTKTSDRRPLDHLDQLDDDIALAWAAVKEARVKWAHSPNSETFTNEQAAVALMDKLLKLRHDIDPHELTADVLERLGLS